MTSNFKHFLDKTSLKFKEVSPGIMTALSIIGLAGTVTLTIRATLKTNDILKKAEEEKGEKLTVVEKIQIGARPCAPAAAAGTATALLMLSSHSMSKMQIATLTAGYAALNQNYKKYMQKTKELLGEDGCKKIRQAILSDEVERVKPENPDDGKMLYFEEIRGEFFEKTEAEVVTAEYELNRRMAKDGHVSLNTFYDMLDLKPVDGGDDLGWSYESLIEQIDPTTNYDEATWIEFTHETYELEDGLQAIQIIFPHPPVHNYIM